MNNYLDDILQRKEMEVATLHNEVINNPKGPLAQIYYQENGTKTNCSFSKAISSHNQLSVIAEIKRRSPSKGLFGEIKDPVQLAKMYQAGGAKAISILTDQEGFGGSLNDLSALKRELNSKDSSKCPLIRKDFIIDRLQIAESVLHGADAILLIVKITQASTESLLVYAEQLGLEVLVEVNTLDEVKLALSAGAKMIAVNNRDLDKFTVDINRSLELIHELPNDIVKVSASGIENSDQARQLRNSGYEAVLIGESLVKAHDPAALIREMI